MYKKEKMVIEKEKRNNTKWNQFNRNTNQDSESFQGKIVCIKSRLKSFLHSGFNKCISVFQSLAVKEIYLLIMHFYWQKLSFWLLCNSPYINSTIFARCKKAHHLPQSKFWKPKIEYSHSSSPSNKSKIVSLPTSP